MDEQDLINLRRKLDVQAMLIDGLTNTVEMLVEAVSGLRELVERHDRTIRSIHLGLHATTDPKLRDEHR